MAEEKAINFGEYAIATPVEHYFEKQPDKYWRVKPVTSGMELERSKFIAHNRIIEMPFGERVEMPATTLEIVYREIALTFGGTNLAYEDGDPFIDEEASIEGIEASLREMPSEMVREIWKAVGKANPGWGPARRDEEVPDEETVEDEDPKA